MDPRRIEGNRSIRISSIKTVTLFLTILLYTVPCLIPVVDGFVPTANGRTMKQTSSTLLGPSNHGQLTFSLSSPTLTTWPTPGVTATTATTRTTRKKRWHSLIRVAAAVVVSAVAWGGVLAAPAMAATGTNTKNLALVASGGPGDVAEIVVSAYDWCTNLGNPSALVAGAVVATLYENMNSGSLDVRKRDKSWVRFGKRLTRVLLLSAFACEVISIFVTIETGTMLLSKTLDVMDDVVPVMVDTTPLQFFRENFEFEFLTARLTFLQGLVNWLAAIGIGHFIINGDQSNADDAATEGDDLRHTKVGRSMNKFIGCSMLSCITVMLAFYNKHLDYYHNVGHMWFRWWQLLLQRYIFKFPIRPMVLLYVPSILATLLYGVKAFVDRPDDDDDDNIESVGGSGDGDGDDNNNKVPDPTPSVS